ncbi:MAG: sigma-70 family RNA polymerase sigma factor [Bacteroidetes bacterium]|nr:MAG: sigma-70 family RNA polymerase sigma factor [Bacteroidota bacterium]
MYTKPRYSHARKERIFEQELLPLLEALHNFAYHLTKNEEDANDLVQETYLRALRFLDKYDAGSNAKAWMFRIMKNIFINKYRRRSKAPTQVELFDSTSFHDEDQDAPQSNFVDLREEVFQDLMGDEVSRALNALPVDYRIVLILYELEDFTYEEIASILDIPIGTVRSRLHRARNLLKKQLEAYARAHGYGNRQSE